VVRLAVCKLNPARYGRAEHVMTDGLSSCTQKVLVVDISELDTKLVTATKGNKLFGLVYRNTSGMACRFTQCVHAATHLITYNTSTSASIYFLR